MLNLCVFYCLCFVSIYHHKPTKFGARSLHCIFLCYPYNTKGYRVYDLAMKKIFISQDVIFYEYVIPYVFVAPISISPIIPNPCNQTI